MLPENAPERIGIDWDNLKKEAPDLVGWITLPAVELSYPIVQGKDNMWDGTMFAKLKDYTEPETYQKCPCFWIYTDRADYLYEICSVYQSAPEQAPYVLRFASHSDYLD